MSEEVWDEIYRLKRMVRELRQSQDDGGKGGAAMTRDRDTAMPKWVQVENDNIINTDVVQQVFVNDDGDLCLEFQDGRVWFYGEEADALWA